MPNSSANSTPATAAARGVVRCGDDGCAGVRRHASHGRIAARLRLAGQQPDHQPVGLGQQIAVRVTQFGVDERLAPLGLADPAARRQRRVDRRDLAVVDVQEAGPADRAARARGSPCRTPSRTAAAARRRAPRSCRRREKRLNCTLNSTPSGPNLLTRVRRHQQAARAGQRRAPGWPDRHPRPPRTGSSSATSSSARSAASIPGVAVGVGRHREILQPAHRRQEPAEPRTRFGRLRRAGSRRACRSPGSTSRRDRRSSGRARQDVAAHDRLIAARARRRCTKHVLRQALPAAARSRAPWRAGRRTRGASEMSSHQPGSSS